MISAIYRRGSIFLFFLKNVTLHIFAKFWFSSEWCLTMFPPVFCFTDNLLCVSALLNEVTLKYLQLRALWVLWILRKGASVLPWLPPSPEDTLKCPSSKSSKLSLKPTLRCSDKIWFLCKPSWKIYKITSYVKKPKWVSCLDFSLF